MNKNFCIYKIKLLFTLTTTSMNFDISEQCKGRIQLKILVVFTTKTGGEGSGQLLTILLFFNRGPANY